MPTKRRQNRAPLPLPDRTPAKVVPIHDGVVTIPRGALLQLAMIYHDIKKATQQREASYAKAA